MLLKACLNGSRKPSEHPALPLTSQALAHNAQLVVSAGASALHIHPRDDSGAQSLAAQHIAAALTAIRTSSPALPIGVSTGIWIEHTATQRLQCVQGWQVQPDFASVNFSEPGTIALCTHLLNVGVGIEAGLDSIEDVQLLLQSGLASHCLRILIEPQEQQVASALATADAIIAALDIAHVQLPRLLHGDNEATVWPLLEAALQHGYATRIGLEDTLTLPDGSPAKDNAELVSLARQKATQAGF